ncbi:transglutaminase-like domain-containing protein [Candidatus Raskinella chloraquaticus]|jgi:transglutaminase-like putative cysteine protease|uniref:Transglutaminase n=1 Tax=Candidatus Raskinella chloraquaticus TaxID=1951219 RepID=A0A1W9HQ79_9HYPH|nr:MAG: transglutaminase [Proteobacteria bacterium SG_bin8]
MKIAYGYDIEIECANETPVIALVDIHPTRRGDICRNDIPVIRSLSFPDRDISSELYQDKFGNLCRRFVAPAGRLSLCASGLISDSGMPDGCDTDAAMVRIEDLPSDVLEFTLGSRYCETDILSEQAWARFGRPDLGWWTVQAICDYVHDHITFDYLQARSTRSAAEGLRERIGVCRDFAHLAITLCRCLNIPARYCTGYLGDIGVPADPNPMDFSAWFEAYLDGRWWTFDARHNQPRIGRIVIARGRDATDVPILNSYGPHVLRRFDILTQEMASNADVPPSPLMNTFVQLS